MIRALGTYVKYAYLQFTMKFILQILGCMLSILDTTEMISEYLPK